MTRTVTTELMLKYMASLFLLGVCEAMLMQQQSSLEMEFNGRHGNSVASTFVFLPAR